MKLAPFLLLIQMAIAQPPTGPARTTGTCNIANMGTVTTVTLNCTGLTPSQQRLLASVPDLLNNLLAAQADNTAEILSRLYSCIDTSELAQRQAAAAARGVTTIYNFNGSQIRTINRANGRNEVVSRDIPEAFGKMLNMAQSKLWADLVKLADEQIGTTPEWLTPYFFKAIAELGLGQGDIAIKLLIFVRDQSGGNPEYSRAAQILQQFGIQ